MKLREAAKPSEGRVEVVPHEDPVNPEQLFDSIASTIKKFIVCPAETADAATLWIVNSWLIDITHVSPLAVITAPEKRCGKSQLLFLIGRLCKNPLAASNISPAALFRSLEAWKPTLLIDEADAFLATSEELRGIINAGHTRDSAYVIRVVGDDHVPKQFNVYGAKAIAGIGQLQDTLMDRSIQLRLRRKLPDETVDRLRHAQTGMFAVLSQKLARFEQDFKNLVASMRPKLPAQLNDRAQDNWEPLLAIAHVAGKSWIERANKAAIALSADDSNSVSTNIELLMDIRSIRDDRFNNTESISSPDLVKSLIENEEAPWATYNRGNPMSVRQLNKRLKEFGIVHHQSRALNRKRVIMWADFNEVWKRYLPDPFAQNDVTVCQPSVSDDLSVTRSEVSRVHYVTVSECVTAIEPNSLKSLERHTVTRISADGPKDMVGSERFKFAPATETEGASNGN
jgi:putative DNA primase/helicase